jgi:flagellar basal-body rod modification protein FlgD
MNIMGLDQVSSMGGQVEESKGSILGKDDFLHLLVTQLQNQDPLNPADSTEFTAQLATFSSLEELQNINTALEDIGASQTVLTNSQAVDYIGQTITAVGDQFTMMNEAADPLNFNLDGDAAGVYIKIYNQYGEFVRDIELGPMSAGQNSATWDGLDQYGLQASDGVYNFEVMAVDEEGAMVDATAFTQGTVTGVVYKNGLAYLIAGDQEIPLGNVVEVFEPEAPAEDGTDSMYTDSMY